MEATPVGRGPAPLRLAAIENHPFRHLVRSAEHTRAARDRAMDYARSHLEHAAQVHFQPYAQMYRDVASTYVSIARKRNHRLLEKLREMRAVSP